MNGLPRTDIDVSIFFYLAENINAHYFHYCILMLKNQWIEIAFNNIESIIKHWDNWHSITINKTAAEFTEEATFSTLTESQYVTIN